MDELTEKQKRLLDYIKDYARACGRPPTLREMAQHCSCVVGTIQDHLKSLELKGFVKRLRGQARALELTPQALGIPLYGRVRAGTLHTAFGHPEGYVYPTPGLTVRGELFALTVRGDSMTGAGIMEGDVAIIRKQQTAEDGDIVVALVGDDATLKRFHRIRREVYLEPANPEYKAIPARNAVILGKVVQIQRRYQ